MTDAKRFEKIETELVELRKLVDKLMSERKNNLEARTASVREQIGLR